MLQTSLQAFLLMTLSLTLLDQTAKNLYHKVNYELDKIEYWMKINKLSINYLKTSWKQHIQHLCSKPETIQWFMLGTIKIKNLC